MEYLAIPIIVFGFGFLVVFVILPCYVAAEVGAPKGRVGWAWGLFFGWLGVFAVYVLPSVQVDFVPVQAKAGHPRKPPTPTLAEGAK